MMLALLAFMSFPAAYADNQTISFFKTRCDPAPVSLETDSLSDWGPNPGESGGNECVDLTNSAGEYDSRMLVREWMKM